MPIKTRLANKPIQDSLGYVLATLTDIVEVDDSDYSDSIKFIFESEGTQKSINFTLYTGVTINPDKYPIDGKKEDFNKLTKLILSLKLIDESKLKSLKSEDCDPIIEELTNLKGSQFKFKLSKSTNKKQLFPTIDLSTIELVTEE